MAPRKEIKKVHLRGNGGRTSCGANRGENRKNSASLTRKEKEVTCRACRRIIWNRSTAVK